MFVGTIGATIKYNILQDITGSYTQVGFIIHKPNSETDVDWVGSVQDKSRIVYTVKSGDLDTAGKYTLQAYVRNDASICFSEVKSFIVQPTL